MSPGDRAVWYKTGEGGRRWRVPAVVVRVVGERAWIDATFPEGTRRVRVPLADLDAAPCPIHGIGCPDGPAAALLRSTPHGPEGGEPR